MYKIILIDDDSETLRAIVSHFDWSSMGLEVSGTADSGPAGLQAIVDGKPDILLIDIRMPGMDGLSVIREAHSRGIWPYCIIISAHADFEYAQTALRLSVCEYLLKPFSPEDLRAALGRAVADLERRIPERVLARYGFPLSGSEALVYPEDLEKAVLACLLACRREDLEPALEAFLLRAFSLNRQEDALACVSRLYSAIVRPLLEQGMTLDISPAEGIRWESRDLAGSIRQFLTGVLHDTCAALHCGPDVHPVVAAAQRYIRGHFRERLALDAVASAVHVTPNYLSSLFSRNLGVSFVTYVNRVRIAQARAILEDPAADPALVAEQVGFGDNKYFTQVFRQSVGCTPHRYRSRALGGNRSSDSS